MLLSFLLLFVLPVVWLAPFEMVFFLAAGWLTYPLRVWPEATINWEGVLTGVVMVVMAGAGLHLILSKWRRLRPATGAQGIDAGDRTSPVSSRTSWRLSATMALVALVVMGFAFTLAATGMLRHGHGLLQQDQWIKSSWNWDWKDSQVRALDRFMQLLIRWQDEEPEQAGAVYRPTDILATIRSGNQPDFHYADFSHPRGRGAGMPGLWIPVDGIPVDGNLDLPVLVSPLDGGMGIIVATPARGATVMTFEEWHDALEQWRPRFVEHGIPWPRAFDVLGR